MSPQADALSTRIMRCWFPGMLSTYFITFLSSVYVAQVYFLPVLYTGNMPGFKYISGYAAMTGQKNCGHSSINSDLDTHN